MVLARASGLGWGKASHVTPTKGFAPPKVNPNNLIERLEILILETKAGHNGLSDEMLNISKQILSMNIINEEQLYNFVINYGK